MVVKVKALVVKWISQRSSEPSFQVRILAGAQNIGIFCARRSASPRVILVNEARARPSTGAHHHRWASCEFSVENYV